MAANIPPPNPMVLTGDWNTNWNNFRDEFEDYALATSLHEKPNEVEAATIHQGPPGRTLSAAGLWPQFIR